MVDSEGCQGQSQQHRHCMAAVKDGGAVGGRSKSVGCGRCGTCVVSSTRTRALRSRARCIRMFGESARARASRASLSSTGTARLPHAMVMGRGAVGGRSKSVGCDRCGTCVVSSTRTRALRSRARCIRMFGESARARATRAVLGSAGNARLPEAMGPVHGAIVVQWAGATRPHLWSGDHANFGDHANLGDHSDHADRRWA